MIDIGYWILPAASTVVSMAAAFYLVSRDLRTMGEPELDTSDSKRLVVTGVVGVLWFFVATVVLIYRMSCGTALAGACWAIYGLVYWLTEGATF